MIEIGELYLLNGSGSGYGYGSGSGYGDGSGDGYGYGSGSGSGYGSGSGSGYGYGDGSGSGYGYGSGDGYGDGSGSGSGYGSGDGSGYGYGSGDGYGDGDGSGSGSGYGSGIYKLKIFGRWIEVSGKIENSLCNNLPDDLLTHIDKSFIQKVDNLESLRKIRERLGVEKYIGFFEAKEIHSSIDNQGNKMRLFKYDEAGEKVLLLEVICPSTQRMYHIYPPNQKAKTCEEAKASTFSNKKISLRQGDVALMNLKDLIISQPITET